MTQFVILVNQKSTMIRNACQAVHVPYVAIYTGFDRVVDGALELVKALVPNQDVRQNDSGG